MTIGAIDLVTPYIIQYDQMPLKDQRTSFQRISIYGLCIEIPYYLLTLNYGGGDQRILLCYVITFSTFSLNTPVGLLDL